ncbi:porin [Massilia consociata]|uniref:Porin n=1 Tax=Massilia consociata TaxID=760117 RepID=A0ABV6FH68_9BURK
MHKQMTGPRAVLMAAMLATAFTSSAADAQGNVAIYGIVDTAVARMTNANARGEAITRVSSLTGTVPSRFGVRGSEDLGGGLSAVFTLEGGFNSDSGTSGQGGRLFGRQAWVGLKGSWGTLQVGRVNNMTLLAPVKSDVLGPNLFSINSIDPYLAGARSDNAIAYLGSFDGLQLGATYSFGRDNVAGGCAGELAGAAKACRQVTGLVGYEMKEYGLNLSYDKFHGTAGGAGGLDSSERFDRRVSMNGYYMLGSTRLGGGIIRRKLDAATGISESDLYYLGFSQPISAQLSFDAQAARKDVKASGDDTNMLVARLTYAFTKRTAVYGAVGRMDNRGAAAIALDLTGTVGVGMTQNGFMAGIRHIF